MKLKQLAAICAKSSMIYIYQRDGSALQYIGNGTAVYPVPGLPEVDEKTVTVTFDVPEKKRADYYIKKTGLPERISLADCETDDTLVERLKISIDGMTMFKTSRGLLAIDGRYIKPISDAESVEYYERQTTDAAAPSVIVAKAGFDLLAVILPVKIGDEFCKRIAEALALCRVAAEMDKRTPAAEGAGEQTEMRG